MGMLVSILIGALAGIIAGKLMNYDFGLIMAIVVGVVGGFLGSWLFSIIGLPVSTSFWGQLLVGTVGAVVLLWIVSRLKKK